MITPNPIEGTGLHAIGGISASTCYLPYHRTKNWSWTSFWLVQSLFAWIIVPFALAILTVPGFFFIISAAPAHVLLAVFLLGACYGFGSMAFGYATRHIGYSLTYTFSIGISAILGTMVPLLLKGNTIAYFSRPGGTIIVTGMLISVLGITLSGLAGFRKEKEMGDNSFFNMRKGIILTIIGGVLSAVFNISLEYGQPLADMAAAKGAGNFQGNAKLIVSTSGCYVVNLVWFLILALKHNNLREFTAASRLSVWIRLRNFLWSALAGTLWCMQFLFFGLGHVKMGNYGFASWVLHMSMLIFFSYIVGLLMKEWKGVSRNTRVLLVLSLSILCIAFLLMAYGGYVGEHTSMAALEISPVLSRSLAIFSSI